MNLSIEEMKQHINGNLQNQAIQELIRTPKEKCFNAAELMGQSLASVKEIKVEYGGIKLYEGLSTDGMTTDNHYIVVAKSGGNVIYVDLTIAQFEAGASPFVDSREKWESKIKELKKSKTILMKIVSSSNDAKAFAEGPSFKVDDKTKWINVGAKGDKFLKNPLTNYFHVLTDELTIFKGQNQRDSHAKKKLEQDIAVIRDKINKDENPIRLKATIIDDINKFAGDHGVARTLKEYFNKPDSEQSSLFYGMEKLKSALKQIIVMRASKLDSYVKNKSAWRKIEADIYAGMAEENFTVKTAVKNFFTPVGGDGRLSIPTNDLFEKKTNWKSPEKEDFTHKIFGEIEPDHKHKKRVVIQLESDYVSFFASKHLFDKGISSNTWIQHKDGNLNNGYRWGSGDGKLSYQEVSLTPDSDGVLNIALVGHGKNEGKEFGGLNSSQIKNVLGNFREAFKNNNVKKISLDFVGCELVAPGDFSSTLLSDVLNWLKDDPAMKIAPVKLIATGSQYPIRVAESGKKQYYISGKGWVDSADARLSGFMYKNEIKWSAVSNAWSIDYPSGYFDKLLKFTSDELLSSGEVKKQLIASTTETLVKEKLKIIDQGNDFYAVLKKRRGTNNDWTSTGDIVGGKLCFIDVEGKKHWVGISTDEITATTKFKNTLENLTSEVKKSFTISNDGRTLTKINTGSQIAGSTLNAVFFIKTLLDGGLWGEADTQTKVLLFQSLTAQGIGLVSDTTQAAKFISDAAKLNWIGSNALDILQKTSLVAGVFTDAIALIFSIQALATNKNPDKTAALATNLALNIVSTGLTTAVIVSSVVGATTIATALGVLGLPLVGLGIGLNALMEAIERNKINFRKVDGDFSQFVIDPNELLDSNDFLTKLKNDKTSIKSINFKNNTIALGEIKISPTEVAGGHSRVSDWWDHVALGGTRFGSDKAKFLELYEGLDFPKEIGSRLLSCQEFMLPGTPSVFISFEYDHGAGLRWMDAAVFKKLSSKYKEKFIWGFFSVGRDNVISKMKPEFEKTTISINLDDKTRILHVPSNMDGSIAKMLEYDVAGGNGKCTIKMSAAPVGMSLTSIDNATDHWKIIFNNESLTRSDYTMFKKVFDNLTLHEKPPESIEISSGAKIKFNGKAQEYEFQIKLVSGVKLLFQKSKSVSLRLTLEFNNNFDLVGDISGQIESFVNKFNFPSNTTIFLTAKGIPFGSYELGSKKLALAYGIEIHRAIDRIFYSNTNNEAGSTYIIKTDGDGSSPKGFLLPERVEFVQDTENETYFKGVKVYRYRLSKSGFIALTSTDQISRTVWGESLKFLEVGGEILMHSDKGDTYFVAPRRGDNVSNLLRVFGTSNGSALLNRNIEVVGDRISFTENVSNQGSNQISLPYIFDKDTGKCGYLLDMQHDDLNSLAPTTDDIPYIVRTLAGLTRDEVVIENDVRTPQFPLGYATTYDPSSDELTTSLGYCVTNFDKFGFDVKFVPQTHPLFNKKFKRIRATGGQMGMFEMLYVVTYNNAESEEFNYYEMRGEPVPEWRGASRLQRNTNIGRPINFEFLGEYGDEFSSAELMDEGLLVYGRSGIVYNWNVKQAIGVTNNNGGYISLDKAVLKSCQDLKIEKLKTVMVHKGRMIIEGASGLLYSVNSEGDICLFGSNFGGLYFSMISGSVPLNAQAKLIQEKNGDHYVLNGNTLIQFFSSSNSFRSARYIKIDSDDTLNNYFQSDSNQLKITTDSGEILSVSIPEALQKIIHHQGFVYFIGDSGQAYRIAEIRNTPIQAQIDLCGLQYAFEKDDIILTAVDIQVFSKLYRVALPTTLTGLDAFMKSIYKLAPGECGNNAIDLSNVNLYGGAIKCAYRAGDALRYLDAHGLVYQYQQGWDCIVGNKMPDQDVKILESPIYITNSNIKYGITDRKLTALVVDNFLYDADLNKITIPFVHSFEIDFSGVLFINSERGYYSQGAKFIVDNGRLKLYEIDINKMHPDLNVSGRGLDYMDVINKYPLGELYKNNILNDGDYILVRDSKRTDESKLKSTMDDITRRLQKGTGSRDWILDMLLRVNNRYFNGAAYYVGASTKMYGYEFKFVGNWHFGQVISEKNAD